MIYASTPSQISSTNTAIATHDLAKLLLRLVLGLLILMHGISKLRSGPGFVLDVVSQAGLPTAFAYLVYIGEIVAPLFLIFGLWARAAAAVIAINMIVAILLVHTSQLFSLSDTGGWAIELQAMYLGTAVAIVLLGAGRYSIGGTNGRWN
jgi:putative oxidoreductase